MYSRKLKLRYGVALHSVVEHPFVSFKTEKQLKKFLHYSVGNVPDTVVSMLWRKLHSNTVIARFRRWLASKLKEGYHILVEKPLFVPSSRGKLHVVRPDIVLINHSKKSVIIIEVKSKTHFRKSQLRKYARAYKKLLGPSYSIRTLKLIVGKNLFEEVHL